MTVELITKVKNHVGERRKLTGLEKYNIIVYLCMYLMKVMHLMKYQHHFVYVRKNATLKESS
jgi:hypothetical protein